MTDLTSDKKLQQALDYLGLIPKWRCHRCQVRFKDDPIWGLAASPDIEDQLQQIKADVTFCSDECHAASAGKEKKA